MIPLAPAEKRWIENAVRILIRRKAEFDADPNAPLSKIKMSDIQ